MHLEAIANKQRAGKAASMGSKVRARRRKTLEILRGGSSEKTVSNAQIVSPFPEESYTVHLKTFGLPVTARTRRLLIRYIQNASTRSLGYISSPIILFRVVEAGGIVVARNQSSLGTLKISAQIGPSFPRAVINVW